MDKYYDAKSIENILNMLKGIVINIANNEFCIKVDITTTEGLCKTIKISNDRSEEVEINKNIIIYNDTAISLRDIIKMKISLNDISDKNIKHVVYKRLKNIAMYNTKNTQTKNQGLSRKYNNRSEVDDIENYIKKNYSKIKTISYNGIKDENKSITMNVEVGDVLSSDSTVDVSKDTISENAYVNCEKCDVVNSIQQSELEVINEIKLEEKFVLTSDAKEVEVAKPIQTREVEVINNLDILEYEVMVNPTQTTVVKEVVPKTSKMVTRVETNYIDGAIVDINKEKQIVRAKKVELLGVETINPYVTKKELNGKILRFDPTGENYVGVVLDDGTFEPLKIELKTYTVLEDNTTNYVGNIDANNQVKTIVKEVHDYKIDVIENIQVEYNEDVAEYCSKKVRGMSDIIRTSKETVNSVVNKEDTVQVVTKEKMDILNNISNINNATVTKVDKVNTVPVIESIEIETKTKDIISDVKLNKKNEEVIKGIESITEDKHDLVEENIDGSIELVGGGIMVIEDDNENITIYSTSKIKSVN